MYTYNLIKIIYWYLGVFPNVMLMILNIIWDKKTQMISRALQKWLHHYAVFDAGVQSLAAGGEEEQFTPQ